jgi:hypothetical protein
MGLPLNDFAQEPANYIKDTLIELDPDCKPIILFWAHYDGHDLLPGQGGRDRRYYYATCYGN